MSALHDIADEIFLQESDFPATLLLGMEGAYGLVITLFLYLITLPYRSNHTTDNDDNSTVSGVPSSFPVDRTQITPFLIVYSVGLTLWFTVTGIFNVWATEATSSMTRNVWKNARTLLVWLIGLIIYYSYDDSAGGGDGGGQTSVDSNDDDGGYYTYDNSVAIIGEKWTNPESYIILLGYLIMLGGLYVYYQ